MSWRTDARKVYPKAPRSNGDLFWLWHSINPPTSEVEINEDAYRIVALDDLKRQISWMHPINRDKIMVAWMFSQ